MKGQVNGAQARQWLANIWLDDGSLESVQEINAQCLELLAQMGGGGALGRATTAAKQWPNWAEVSGAVREQLASSPYLLVDAGFANEARWRGLREHAVQDVPAMHAEPVFHGAGAETFIRRVLVFSWHIAKANPQLARIVLGMAPGCAAQLSVLRLRDLDWVAETRPGWVRLRWEAQPAVWRHLVGAAMHRDPGKLTQASLRGIQMLAATALRAEGPGNTQDQS